MKTAKLEAEPIDKIAPSERYCTDCGKKLIKQFAWLERNWRTGEYSIPGSVPEKLSQGCFPFGVTCAKAAIR